VWCDPALPPQAPTPQLVQSTLLRPNSVLSLSLRLLQAGSGGGMQQPLLELGAALVPLLRLVTHPAVLDDPRSEIPNTVLAVAFENLDLGRLAADLEAVAPDRAPAPAAAGLISTRLLNAVKVRAACCWLLRAETR
jgi:hypothetical protein